jgi:hypothetical protein
MERNKVMSENGNPQADPDPCQIEAGYCQAHNRTVAYGAAECSRRPCPPELAECLRLAQMIAARVGAVVYMDKEKGLYDRPALKLWGSINIEADPEVTYPGPAKVRKYRGRSLISHPRITGPGFRVYAIAYDSGDREQPPEWEPAREAQFELPYQAVRYAFQLWLDCLIDGVLENDAEDRMAADLKAAEDQAEQIERMHLADTDLDRPWPYEAGDPDDPD